MYNKGIDLRVCVNGRPMREYSHGGLQFIESRHGTNYTIKIKNDNSFKCMVVLSVDGLDVITGKAAEKSNKGYIVDGHSSTEIKGYRVTDENSAAFMFTSKDGSYTAETTGDKRNSGVIGIRVFDERKEKIKEPVQVIEKHIHHHYPKSQPWSTPPLVPHWPWAPTYYTTQNVSGGIVTTGVSTDLNSSVSYTTSVGSSVSHTTQNAGGCSVGKSNSSGVLRSMLSQTASDTGNSPGVSTKVVDNCIQTNCSNAFDTPINYDNFDSGTTWGKKQTDLVKRVEFKKGKLVTELVIYYATKDALSKMGVDLTETPAIAHDPKPKAFGSSQYCQPPKGWSGV